MPERFRVVCTFGVFTLGTTGRTGAGGVLLAQAPRETGSQGNGLPGKRARVQQDARTGTTEDRAENLSRWIFTSRGSIDRGGGDFQRETIGGSGLGRSADTRNVR